MKLRELVTDAEQIGDTLRALGEPTEAPARAPARDPPLFKSQIVRRRFGETTQGELFDS